ncbi:MAG: class IV adenylate cyclase [bacterium]|nr:class IV adenylate cyclase [bacterium]
MNDEIEVKFLDINPVDLQVRLLSLGAVKKFDRLYKRLVFDYPGLILDKENAWLRLRDEGDQVTLTYKQRQGVKGNSGDDEGMKELEVVVDSFEKTAEILFSVGMIDKGFQENRRVRYEIGGVTVDIDFWPLLSPYVEIEAKRLVEIKEMAEKLGFVWDDRKTFTAYQMYLNMNINTHDYKEISFAKQVKR